MSNTTTLVAGGAGAAIILYLLFGVKSKPIVQAALPPAAASAAALLPPALEAAAKKHGVKVRATLFSAQLEELYAYNMDGVPGIMQKIAQSKAYSCISGVELKNPGLAETMFLYMVPWMVGATNHMPVMGSLPVKFPGMVEPACFVVNGAPAADVDLCINEEVLTACGLAPDAFGVWVLK